LLEASQLAVGLNTKTEQQLKQDSEELKRGILGLAALKLMANDPTGFWAAAAN
jgi:hypothetical protein